MLINWPKSSLVSGAIDFESTALLNLEVPDLCYGILISESIRSCEVLDVRTSSLFGIPRPLIIENTGMLS